MESSGNEEILYMCLLASVVANMAVFCYFFIFTLADLFVKTCHSPTSRLHLAHKHCTEFMRNFYLESVFYTIQGISAIVITLVYHDSVLSFEEELIPQVQLLLAASLGFHLVAFCRVAFLGKSCIVKYTILLMQFMVILTTIAVIVTREDAPIGMIMLVSETDMLFANIGKFHKVIRLKGTRRYRVIVYIGTCATILSRAIIPLGYLAMALLEGSPLKMSVSATTVFFVGLVACGAINTWRINSALARICRKEERIVEVIPYANLSEEGASTGGPKPEEVAATNIELPPSYNEVFATQDAADNTPSVDAAVSQEGGPQLAFTNPMSQDISDQTSDNSSVLSEVSAAANSNAFISINLGQTSGETEPDLAHPSPDLQCSSA
ncbi:uncharacterized protein [Diadema antillarum]|uniref:uncharacterized protein n=1 Tax=Diadema antillarum TaxID=105358 RepID=UPI003A88A98E